MKNKRAVTLIELIMSVAIVAVCVIPVALMYQEALRGSCIVRATTVATALAEEKMEEALGLGYAGVGSVNPTPFASPFDDYSYQVTVHCVNGADLDTPVDPAVTEYKSVLVEVTRSGIKSVSLKSLLTDFEGG